MIRALVNTTVVDDVNPSTCDANEGSMLGSIWIDRVVGTVPAASRGHNGLLAGQACAGRGTGRNESTCRTFASTVQRACPPAAVVLVDVIATEASHSTWRADVVPTASAHLSPLEQHAALAARFPVERMRWEAPHDTGMRGAA